MPNDKDRGYKQYATDDDIMTFAKELLGVRE